MKKLSLQCILAGSITILLSCSAQKNNLQFIDSENFIFLEYIQTNEGKQIFGEVPQGPRIDGPSYIFNKDDKTIQINRKPNFSFDTVKVVIGNGKILKGVAGSGVSTNLRAIGTLPFTIGEITINKINKQGITFTIKNKSVFLKAGEEWKDIVTKTDTFHGANQSIVEYKITKTLNYLGKLTKKSVIY